MLGLDKRLIHKTTQKWLILGMVAGLMDVALTLALFYLLGISLDQALVGENLFAGIVGFVILLFLLKFSFAWLFRTAQSKASAETKVSVRDMVYRHALKLGPGLLGKGRTGQLVNTTVDGMDWLENYYGVYFIQFAVGMGTPVLLCLFILGVDWVVGLSLIVSIPITPFFIRAVSSSFADVSRRYSQVLDSQSAQFLDSIQGMSTLKSFNQSRKRGQEMRMANEELRQETMGLLFVNQMMIAFVDFGFALCSTLVITIVALIRLDGGFVSAGEVVALILASSVFTKTLGALGKFFFAGAVGREIANKILKFLEEKPSIQDSPANKNEPLNLERPAIEFTSVSFSYEGSDVPAINDVSFNINAAETLALIGQSGSGKTTLTNLILRTLKPSAGTIKLDGTSLDELPVDWVRAQIALVPQDPFLFFGTIADNLRVAKENATDNELKAATEAAELYNYIISTPKGFDTMVGEQGLALSGGQVQRLAIARALLKDSPIVILDEPTSQIDVGTEFELTKALQRLTQNKTVLLIAHRLSTVDQADRIVVMGEGKIIEEGTREELLAHDGIYARMVKIKRSTEIHGFKSEEVT